MITLNLFIFYLFILLLIKTQIYIVLVREYMAFLIIRFFKSVKSALRELFPMKDLVQFLTEAADDVVLEKRLKALLTPNEINEMQHRLQIFSLLEQGVPQRDIAKQLGVGIATVTRGSRALKELKE